MEQVLFDRYDIDQRSKAIKARFGLAEWLLYAFSADPAKVYEAGAYSQPTRQWTVKNALGELEKAFPDLIDLIRDKRVLDYGCGDGFQAVALAQRGARFVMGVEIAAPRLEHARKLAAGMGNVSFGDKPEGTFDVAISLNAFEHFTQPEQNLRDLAAAIVPGGKILVAFGPPWLSPYGSHMHFFTKLPWVNILFSEKTVFSVRRLYRGDNYNSYVPDLNKMTIRRFERIVAASGLKVLRSSYHAVQGIKFLSALPGARELFISNVSCILTK